MVRGSHRIFNLGNYNPEFLVSFIHILERHIGKKAIIKRLPMQQGDVSRTYADADMVSFTRTFGDWSRTSLDMGLQKFVEWYKQHYAWGSEINP
jgi:UDP-glucuronate 4-epimerase